MWQEWYIADLVLFLHACPLLWKLIHGLKSSLVAFVVSLYFHRHLIINNALGGSDVQGS
jgi:hypothetical protein